MCASYFSLSISLSLATLLGRSRYQTSEVLNSSEIPTELPTRSHGGPALLYILSFLLLSAELVTLHTLAELVTLHTLVTPTLGALYHRVRGTRLGALPSTVRQQILVTSLTSMAGRGARRRGGASKIVGRVCGERAHAGLCAGGGGDWAEHGHGAFAPPRRQGWGGGGGGGGARGAQVRRFAEVGVQCLGCEV